MEWDRRGVYYRSWPRAIATMTSIDLVYLNGPDVEALALTDDEILDAVEAGLRAQGSGQTVIEPRVHLVPESSAKGHFNVLRGVVSTLGVAGVKIVGDFVDNWKRGLPSELAVLNLFDPETGAPRAILDASDLTDMRTGAMTALGAKYLARKDARKCSGTSVRGAPPTGTSVCSTACSTSTRSASIRGGRKAAARSPRRSARDLGKQVEATDDWESCVRDADIVVEASRLPEPQPLLRTEWIKQGALVVPYGTMSAVEITLTDIMDKIVVDDWGQCRKGLPFGALRRHVDEGRLHEGNLHAELGQIVAGKKPGRERDDETNLFWHRGLSLSDIALGCAMLDKATRLGIGQTLRFR